MFLNLKWLIGIGLEIDTNLQYNILYTVKFLYSFCKIPMWIGTVNRFSFDNFEKVLQNYSW